MIGWTDISVQKVVYMTMEVNLLVFLSYTLKAYVQVMLKAHPPIKEFQVQNIVDTSLLHHMQLELLFIVHCVFSPGTWVFQHDLITDM
jgi:predicted metal-dependent enzyme (double-stranded beta helix superfamily)